MPVKLRGSTLATERLPTTAAGSYCMREAFAGLVPMRIHDVMRRGTAAVHKPHMQLHPAERISTASSRHRRGGLLLKLGGNKSRSRALARVELTPTSVLTPATCSDANWHSRGQTISQIRCHISQHVRPKRHCGTRGNPGNAIGDLCLHLCIDLGHNAPHLISLRSQPPAFIVFNDVS